MKFKNNCDLKGKTYKKESTIQQIVVGYNVLNK